MKKYKQLDEFLQDLDPERRTQVKVLRQYILNAEPTLIENIKWNAPNYQYKGTDRITFSVLNKEQKVKIILHKGAVEKEDKKAPPIITDQTGLIQWNSNIRGTLVFNNLEEIKDNHHKLSQIFRSWLAA